MLDSIKNKFQLRFKNREFAAKILVGALEDSLKKIKVDKHKDTLTILSIPRGGVIVGDIVTNKLPFKAEFDIIVPRKLAAPHNQEIAIGAIMEDETIYLNDEIIMELEIDKEYIEKEKSRQLDEIKRRTFLYKNTNESLNVKDKIVILVDDGAATGATIIATARWIRKQNPKTLVIGIPVASKNIVETLKKECDLVTTATTPSATNFKTVGQYYQEFKPIEDKEVIEVCKRRNLVKL
ncbi:MAG: phosphoribosyltransferase [Thermoproteota archaeon]|nr:phosphoribosyltransferase [Thermoproteota archaeon]